MQRPNCPPRGGQSQLATPNLSFSVFNFIHIAPAVIDLLSDAWELFFSGLTVECHDMFKEKEARWKITTHLLH